MSIFSTKNLSPQRLSFYTALLLATINAVFSLVFQAAWYVPIIVFVISFLVTYYLYYYTLEHFIYRKIKLIYKFIYQTKATKREEFFYTNLLPQKSIEEVSEDVQKWATSRREEIELLRHNEQFRKEFLMNLAHELRTPIFTIQGYIDTLLSGALEDPQVNKKFLQNASKGVERLVRLMDDLGEISKLESGKIPIVQEQFKVQELIEDVFEELSMKAKERNMQLVFKKGTQGGIEVMADKPKIKQVLVNLVENAIKYGNDNGTITAGSYIVDEKNVYIELSDDGPGIAEPHLSRIFERFYRADRSRNSKIGGTGLGLSIVKHIIEAHGQTVNVRSTVGVGSSFGFMLEKAKD